MRPHGHRIEGNCAVGVSVPQHGVQRSTARCPRLIAEPTIELHVERTRPARRRGYPLAHEPWRIVPHVLVVPAFQLCDPVQLIVLMEADDASLHTSVPRQHGA